MKIGMAALFVVMMLAGGTLARAQQPAPPPAVPPATADDALMLADLERLALAAHPTLRAAEARIEAARHQGAQAGAWPNPTLGASIEEVPFASDDRRGEYGFFAEQTFLLGGKLRLNRAVFDRAADQAQADLELQRHRVLAGVRAAFYGTLAAERRAEVQERLATLVSEAVGITAQLFNVGSADRPDYLETEIEARRAQLALNAARNEAVARRHHLAAVVGAPEIAARPLAGSIDDALPELSRDETLQRFLAASPQLQAARAALARAQAATAAARRETFPDLFVRGGAAYNREREHGGGAIGWQGSLEAGVSLPLWNRNRAGIAAARAEEARAAADVQRVELHLRSQVAMAFSRYLTALRAAESYRNEMLPKAEEAYRLYLARYREMAAAYPQVLISQRTLLDLSAEYLEQLDEAWQTAQQIQGFLAGEPFDSPGEAIEGGRSDRGGMQ